MGTAMPVGIRLPAGMFSASPWAGRIRKKWPGEYVARRNRMAKNTSSESIDETAFQALEDALKIDFNDEQDDRGEPASSAAEARVPKTVKQSSAKPARRSDVAEPSRTPPADPIARAPSFEPANDASRRSSVNMLKALEGGSMRASIRNACIISVLWAVAGVGLAHLIYGSQLWQVGSIAGLLAMPGIVAILIGIVVPVMLFFAFAIMMARAQDLRNAARSMAEVALRLSEPETIASERIMSVGQAVRREVSAMNEGIERTIARATELETLVHSEVNALERSYADNELRVRGLVHELGTERDAIVNHAERIRSSIVGAHEQMKEELSLATEEISVRLATSGEAFASMIDTRAAALTEKTNAAGEALGSLLSAKAEDLVQTLSSSGFALANEFDERLETLTTTLAD